MKKIIVLLMVATIVSCSVKEDSGETKEERESREYTDSLNREIELNERKADSVQLLREKTEKAYDHYIELTKASGSETIAWEHLSDEYKELLKDSKPK